jgi:hypothetical protein
MTASLYFSVRASAFALAFNALITAFDCSTNILSASLTLLIFKPKSSKAEAFSSIHCCLSAKELICVYLQNYKENSLKWNSQNLPPFIRERCDTVHTLASYGQ